MKEYLESSFGFYFRKIFPIAVFIAIITFFVLFIVKKFILNTYLSYLFYEGAGLFIVGFFFSLPIFGRTSQLKAAFYCPTSNTIKDIRRNWQKEVSVGLLLNLLGLTLFAFAFLNILFFFAIKEIFTKSSRLFIYK
ncbi:MAG: hypothetical protein NTV78_00520 [Caldiserica bacterium]|nr:hypothetical protein [Caldisericota bacterium]